MLIKNVKLIFTDSIVPGSVVIQNGKIYKIFLNHNPRYEGEILDGEGLYLSPGFIDIHIHGASNYDTMDASYEGILEISSTLLKHGVTSFLPTTMTCSKEDIRNALSNISQIIKDNSSPNNILGVHLEGPFINKNKIGAQNPEFILEPSINNFKEIVGDFEEIIKIVTLAPEVTGSLDLIKYLNDKKIVASVGHTNATYEETLSSIKNGISHATHLFNAMTQFTHRDPGAVGAILNSNITAECILDGIHLHYASLEMALKIKSSNKIILISDSMRACCMKDGNYTLGGQNVIVKNSSARLENGNLAGSVLTLDKAIYNVKNNLNIPLNDIIKLVTINPSKICKTHLRKGLIKEGYDADLVLFDEDINIKYVFVNGNKKEGII
ncbi:N-acetylglucosamine-6-phosphate deacetylase [Candidatus Arthromitus sp. SFB-rat-Yit]|uniref:N-acetylglucosamine-6-phosphate deacetylase n=1 Tax=Candidatus Arthromitus sp. SFB-rat-Yit TaxID=1041504 RepID=UPI000227A600|nr:N-acetylglucosamine-6-phosphate deacetylase [Candidatus Arthromitus sp. SFB-rat-Yit]BAK81661.1 N-acetylglucosamine-6-phosphate deacetylase [Candidatus Arthromitus sp. SFB-rat-Yit]